MVPACGGKEEFGILLLRTLQLGVWRHGRPLGSRPSITAQFPGEVRRSDTAAATSPHETQVLVLRILIEDFGGEATGTVLCQRVAGQVPAFPGDRTRSATEMRAVLSHLEASRAVALEDMGGSDVIARITGEGVILAYDQPWLDAGTAPASAPGKIPHI